MPADVELITVQDLTKQSINNLSFLANPLDENEIKNIMKTVSEMLQDQIPAQFIKYH